MTDDLHHALLRLSERGEPAGVETLVERIDAELAARSGPTAWPERIRARAARPRPWILATALTVVLALVAAGIVVAGSGSSGTDRRVGADVLAPERLQIAARVALPSGGRSVGLLAAAGGSLWAAVAADGSGRGTLLRLDPDSGAVRARVVVRGDAVSMAPGFGSLWVVTSDPAAGHGALVRLDARTGKEQATIAFATPARVATGAGAVWVTDPTRGELTRIDPGTDALAGTAAIPGASAVAVVGDLVYVVDAVHGVVAGVDARSLQVESTFGAVGTDFTATDQVVTSGSRLWAISAARGNVRQLDLGPQQIGTAVQLPGAVTGVTAAPQGALWLAVEGTGARLGLLRPGALGVTPVARSRRLSSTALAVTRAGLWTLDPKSSTLTLLEAR